MDKIGTLFICLVLMQFVSKSSGNLVSTWFEFDHYDYYISNETRSYNVSETTCTSLGGSLAIFPSEVEHALGFIVERLNISMQYWVGIHRNGDTYHWNNGPVVADHLWGPNEPSRYETEFVARLGQLLSDKIELYDGFLYSEYYFICQRPSTCGRSTVAAFYSNYLPTTKTYGVFYSIPTSLIRCAAFCVRNNMCKNIAYDHANNICYLATGNQISSTTSNHILKMIAPCS